MVELPLEQIGERLLGQQHAGILGEHREQQAHQEAADGLGIVPARLQPPRDGGEIFGNLARGLGGAGGRVERLGIGPDQRQPLPHLLVMQVVEHDAVAGAVGELGISFAGAGEVRIDVDAIADVRDQQDRRPAMIGRQRLGIAFGLALRLKHRAGPAGRPAPRGAALDAGAGGLAENVQIVLAACRSGLVRLAALLGLKDEAVALVAVDAAKALRAVAIVLKHPALEHIIVVRVVGAAAIGRGHADQRAQAVGEALRVRQLRPTRIAPLGDEGVDLLLCGSVPRHGFT